MTSIHFKLLNVIDFLFALNFSSDLIIEIHIFFSLYFIGSTLFHWVNIHRMEWSYVSCIPMHLVNINPFCWLSLFHFGALRCGSPWQAQRWQSIFAINHESPKQQTQYNAHTHCLSLYLMPARRRKRQRLRRQGPTTTLATQRRY